MHLKHLVIPDEQLFLRYSAPSAKLAKAAAPPKEKKESKRAEGEQLVKVGGTKVGEIKIDDEGKASFKDLRPIKSKPKQASLWDRFKELLEALFDPLYPIRTIINFFKGNDLKKKASTDIVGTINKLGQEAIAEAKNPQFKDKYILAYGEGHASGQARDHLSTTLLIKKLPELKKQGFTTLALEMPFDTKLEDHLQDLRTGKLSKRSKALKNKIKPKLSKAAAELFKKNGINDPKLISKLRNMGMETLKKVQDISNDKDKEITKLGAADRWLLVAEEAKKLGMNIVLVDSSAELHTFMAFTNALNIGIQKYIKSHFHELDQETTTKLKGISSDLTVKTSEILQARDIDIANHLAQEFEKVDGNIIALLGLAHAAENPILGTIPTAGILKNGKVPLVSIVAEFEKMYDLGVTTIPLKANACKALEASSLDKPMIIETKHEPLSSERCGITNQNSYSNCFKAAIVIPDCEEVKGKLVDRAKEHGLLPEPKAKKAKGKKKITKVLKSAK